MEKIKTYPQSIIKAIHQVMTKVEYVTKDKKNEFQKYKYASEAALIAALRPEILDAGLILVPSGEELLPIDQWGVTHIVMTFTLAHIDGSVWPDKLKAFGAGSDRSSKDKDGNFTVGDKGTYKAITGGNKYFLRNLFQIETGDDPEKPTAKEKKEKEQADKDGKSKASTKTTTSSQGKEGKKVSASQVKRFHSIKKDFGWTDTAAKVLLGNFGYESTADIEAWEDYGTIVKDLQKGMDGKAKSDAKGYCTFCNGEPKKKDSGE